MRRFRELGWRQSLRNKIAGSGIRSVLNRETQPHHSLDRILRESSTTLCDHQAVIILRRAKALLGCRTIKYCGRGFIF